jgi:opacity protein-like surface antigen
MLSCPRAPALVLLLLLPAAAEAQAARRGAPPPDPMLDHTISVTGGLGYASTETRLRFDASDGTPGTPLDGEADLGLDEGSRADRLEVTLRPRPRHRVRLAYDALPGERSASAVIGEDIRFGDDIYLAGETVETRFRLRAWSGSYGYSIVRNPRVEFGVSAGVASIGVRADVGVPARQVGESEEFTVLAPQAGIDVTVRFTDRWYGEARYQYFRLQESDADGQLTRADAAVMFQVNPHLALGLGYTFFEGDIEFTDPGESSRYRQRSDSILLLIRAGL